MADGPRPLSATFHVGESCAFADGPGVWPITRGQRERTAGLGWQFTSLDAALSAEKQANDIVELVEWRVDALTAYTLQTTLAEPGYERARAAGIPVVTFGSESPSAVAVIRQRVDSALCAANAAAYLAARVRHARVLVIGGPPIPALAPPGRDIFSMQRRAQACRLSLMRTISATSRRRPGQLCSASSMITRISMRSGVSMTTPLSLPERSCSAADYRFNRVARPG